MEKLAERLANYILSQGVIEKEDYAIYKYGFQTGIELLLCVATSMGFAVYMGKIWECVLLMAIFFSQRAYVEGIHMKKFSTCFFLSCGVIVGGLKVSEMTWMPDKIMLIVIFVCLFGIYKLAAADSKRMPADNAQKYFSRQRRRVMSLLGGAAIAFYVCNYSVGLHIILYTEIIVCLSAILKIAGDKR
ncbi:MAG: accessory gene regulator B family protein [Clostridiales bacterium]|nr:accessory gene regulator B family protein [Clostridiales bacterium]